MNSWAWEDEMEMRCQSPFASSRQMLMISLLGSFAGAVQHRFTKQSRNSSRVGLEVCHY
jgi:hypothetical protein